MNLFYREKGTGYPLFILHGLWGASDNWLHVTGLLSDHFRVILPDLRNHGQSPHSPIHDYDALSDDIITLIDSLRLEERPFITGHSMGGKTLMALLLKRPEIVKKAIVIDIVPIPYPMFGQEEHLRIAEFIICNNLTGCLNRQEISELISTQFKEDDLCQLLLKNIRKENGRFEWKVNAEAIKNNIKCLAGWPENFKHAAYNEEILFIRAGQSGYIRKEDWPAVKSIFPGAILRQITDGDHRIHVSQPVALASAVKSFLLSSPGIYPTSKI